MRRTRLEVEIIRLADFFQSYGEGAYQIMESFSNSISSSEETTEPYQNDDTYRRRDGLILERAEHFIDICDFGTALH